MYLDHADVADDRFVVEFTQLVVVDEHRRDGDGQRRLADGRLVDQLTTLVWAVALGRLVVSHVVHHFSFTQTGRAAVGVNCPFWHNRFEMDLITDFASSGTFNLNQVDVVHQFHDQTVVVSSRVAHRRVTYGLHFWHNVQLATSVPESRVLYNPTLTIFLTLTLPY